MPISIEERIFYFEMNPELFVTLNILNYNPEIIFCNLFWNLK